MAPKKSKHPPVQLYYASLERRPPGDLDAVRSWLADEHRMWVERVGQATLDPRSDPNGTARHAKQLQRMMGRIIDHSVGVIERIGAKQRLYERDWREIDTQLEAALHAKVAYDLIEVACSATDDQEAGVCWARVAYHVGAAAHSMIAEDAASGKQQRESARRKWDREATPRHRALKARNREIAKAILDRVRDNPHQSVNAIAEKFAAGDGPICARGLSARTIRNTLSGDEKAEAKRIKKVAWRDG